MPITYDVGTNTITVTGYTEATPCNFTDIYNADKAGTLTLVDRDGITAVDTDPVNNTYNLRPADEKLMGGAKNDLWILIENWSGFTDATIRLIGTDEAGNALQEDIVVTGNGTYYASELFKTLTQTQIVAVTGTGSFDYALVQGQWGVVWKQGDNSFTFDAKIAIGDGTTVTWFADESKQFVMKENLLSAHFQDLIHILNNAHFRLGRLISATAKTTRFGCDFLVYSTGGVWWSLYLFRADDGAEFNLFSCHLSDLITDGYKFVRGGNGTAKVYNCIFDHASLFGFSNIDAYNIFIQWSAEGFYSLEGTLDKLTHVNARVYAVTFYGAVSTMKNVRVRDSEQWDIRGGKTSGNAYLVNPDFDSYHIRWLTTPYPTIYRQYEFDLKVQDKNENAISGAAVKIWDKDDNLVTDTTTDVNGEIATQTLNYGYYTQPNGDTPTMQTPHTIEISKAGYQTYKKKFTVDEKISWRIRLLQAKPVQLLEDKPILQLCPESQEDDRIVFVAL